MGDEGSSSKLDNLSKEDLIKLVKKYIVLHKQLRTKNEDLTKQLENQVEKDEKLKQLENENSSLQNKIQNLNMEIENLNTSLDEFKKYKQDFESELESARREIVLNKSMLEMLNNEIKLLNSEKLQLEKRLINTRRNTTPSVIVEEEEEDLEEEERNDQLIPQRSDQLHSIDEETESENIEHNQDVEFLRQNKNISNDGILILNKQIEDMTFYVDELKSELEAEKEKNNEYLAEINEYKQKITNLEENKNPQIDSNESISKLNSFLVFLREDFLNSETEYPNIEFEDQVQRELLEKLRDKLIKKDTKIKEEEERVKYLEVRLEKMILEFKTEIDNLESKIEELQNLKQEAENRLKAVQTELDAERDKYKSFQASKNKMLDLEIADFEKSIKALNFQIITKDKEINDIKLELCSQNENLTKLKQELSNLEKERDEEKEKSTKLKQLLVKAKKDVSEAKAHETEHLSTEAQMKAQLESYNLEIENYKIQLADLMAERQRLQDKAQSNSDAYQRTTQLLETKIQSYEAELEDERQKLETLKNEFENYKIKAQHAFKKHKEQSETNSALVNGNEVQKYALEIEQLKSVIVKLNEKLEENQEKIKLLEKENEITHDEYSRALDRNTKLLGELKEKEIEWKTKNQELVKDNTTKNDEVNETIRSLTLQNEALQTQFKEKMKNLNSQHCHSIDLLQSQLEETKLEIDRLNRQIDELKQQQIQNVDIRLEQNKHDSQHMNGFSPLRIEQTNKNNFILGFADRQINEKSESEFEKKNEMKSIEQLLSEPSTPASLSPGLQSDSRQLLNQIDQLKNDLAKGRVQLDHLNELLNESELNNVRLTEQINVLKDEIRRLERNQEREKSISNMEYLKNVVYKFLTFSTPQEKSQLLPVLTTMLKLSQEEQHAIMSYAKASNNLDGSNSGWSSYLPKWSS